VVAAGALVGTAVAAGAVDWQAESTIVTSSMIENKVFLACISSLLLKM
jgi:hypothetical protein